MNTVKQEAYRLHAAGLNLLPIKTDGTKTPALATWAAYTRMRAGDEEMNAWFGPKAPARGLAVVCGDTSGNYLIVDGDMASGEYLIPLAAVTGRLSLTAPADLLAKWEAAPVTRTPTGAWHKHLRCTEPVGSGGKLAMKATEVPEGTEGARLIAGKWTLVETLIETRAQGQIAVLPPSPSACHPSRKPYVLESGDLAHVPVLTPAELETVLNCSRSFNEFIAPEKIAAAPRRPKAEAQAGERPGDAFNRRGDYSGLLERHGWQIAGTQGEKELWTRPGKGHGISATFNHGGCGLFWPFSTNAHPLEADHGYDPFALFAVLNHGGDFSAAAKALYAEGYGDRATPASAPDMGQSAPGGDGGAQEGHRKPLPHVLPCVAAKLAGLPVLVTDAGLCISPEAAEEERKEIFRRISLLHDEVGIWMKFAVGDSWNELPIGSKERWARDTYGPDKLQTIKNHARVARAWPRDMRNPAITVWDFFVQTSCKVFGFTDRAEMMRRYLLRKDDPDKLTLDGIKVLKGGEAQEEEAEEESQPATLALGLEPGRASAIRAEDMLSDLPADCREDLRFVLAAGGVGELRQWLQRKRAELAAVEEESNAAPAKVTNSYLCPAPTAESLFGDEADEMPPTGNDNKHTTLISRYPDESGPEPPKVTNSYPDLAPPAPIDDADSAPPDAERRMGELLAETPKQGPGEYKRSHDTTVSLTPTLADMGIPADVFPFQSPVKECLRASSWANAWARWMRFSGLDNGQPIPDAVTDQIAALHDLWDERHPRCAPPRREAAHA